MNENNHEIVNTAMNFSKALKEKNEQVFFELLTDDSKNMARKLGKEQALEQFIYKSGVNKLGNLAVWEDYQFTNKDNTEAWITLQETHLPTGVYSKLKLLFEDGKWNVDIYEVINNSTV